MASVRISPKEQALVDAARREQGARGPVSAPSRPGRDSRPPEPPPLTPLDQQTVLGWDHPRAAQGSSKVTVNGVAEEKWARVAALMDAEREAETERRATLKRRALYALLAVAVALLVLVALTVRR
jgi:hypothetical protein